MGFIVDSKGSYLNEKASLIKANSNDISLNYLLSSSLQYEIFSNIHLTLSLIFKYNLNNLSLGKNIDKRYGAFSVNGGFLIDF